VIPSNHAGTHRRIGTDFKPADQLFLDSIREHAVADEDLQDAAANTIDNFKYVFDKALDGLFIDRMEQNEDIFSRFMTDPARRPRAEGDIRSVTSKR
jgi:type I restriction enzyme R subunit